MPSALVNLQTAHANACARLAELDAQPLIDRARMTYTVGQRTYGWNEYRRSLLDQIKEYAVLIKAQLEADQLASGPYTFIGGIGY